MAYQQGYGAPGTYPSAQGAQQGGYPGQVNPQGAQQGGYPGQVNPQGAQQGGYPGQVNPQGAQQGGYPGQVNPQGAQQGGYPGQVKPQGAQQGGYPGQVNPQGAQQGGYPGQVNPQGAQQGGYPGQVNPQGAPGYGQAPAVDPQAQQWFMSVDTDRSGKITSLELQRALVNTNWSHFNEEACRLMIGMFDKDLSGTIDLHEFQALWHYIQQWKQTFDRFDGNKSGSIEGNELQQAFQTMGYNVSPQFIQIIVVKFDHHGKRALTLDNFIQSCVMLKSLTDAFKQRDTSMTGSVRMSYEDFMSLAILYKP